MCEGFERVHQTAPTPNKVQHKVRENLHLITMEAEILKITYIQIQLKSLKHSFLTRETILSRSAAVQRSLIRRNTCLLRKNNRSTGDM